jgi:signal transduction histidine kinase
MKTPLKNLNFKITLAGLWLTFAVSMVAWWWFNGLTELKHFSNPNDPEVLRKIRMITWEGSFFLAAIVIGGASLLILLFRDKARHDQMRLFFSNFNHDLKTSIARVRIQTELLAEQMAPSEPLRRLTEDVNRLNLQLENSLLHSTQMEATLFYEHLKLSEVLRELRPECEELEIKLLNDALIHGDRRIVTSLFRNLIHNSLLHGESTAISIQGKSRGPNRIELTFVDNGSGFQGAEEHFKLLGTSYSRSSGRRGFGLFVARRLLHKMNSEMSFMKRSEGFEVRLQLPGELEI